MKFICHVTSLNHLVREIFDFVAGHLTPKPAFIKFVSRRSLKIEVKTFHVLYDLMWSCD